MATDWRASPAADRDRSQRASSPCSLYRPKILYPVLREIPKSRQTWVIGSPSKRRATNRRRSSMTELSFHGIHTLRKKAESVTHVSGTGCHLCLGLLNRVSNKAPRPKGSFPVRSRYQAARRSLPLRWVLALKRNRCQEGP